MAQRRHQTGRRGRAQGRARQRRSLVLATAIAGTLTLAGTFGGGVAMASTRLGHAVQVRPPLHAAPGSDAFLFGVGCAPTGSCTAGGLYVDSADHDEAMVATETGGHWARAHKLRLPVGAPHNPFAEVNQVSCPAAGSCVAGGYYSVGGRFQGFVAAESHGAWGRARLLTLPANSPAASDFQVTAVACTGPGACVAIGSYQDKNGHFAAYAADESSGRWHQAIELRMPLNAQANPNAFLDGVSCGRAGSCAAGGSYNDNTGAEQAVAVTESGGMWHRGAEVTLPKGAGAIPDASIEAITCPVAGTCLAVGIYTDHLDLSFSFTDTYFNGAWRHASKFTHVPSNAAAHPAADLSGVSCVRAGTCVAVGSYTDKAGGFAPFAAFRHSGHWLAGVQVGQPGNAQGGGTMASGFEGVSCTSSAQCAAVGNYQTKSALRAPMAATTPSI